MRTGSTIWLAILALVTVSCKGERSPAAVDPAGQAARPPPADASRGASLYAEHCASCHGEGRRGDGRGAARLSVAPGDLADPLLLVTRSDDGLARAILQGGAGVGRSKEMPRFAGELSEQDVLDLIAFLRRGAVALTECFPEGTHYLPVGPRGPDTFLAVYASAIPEGGRPVVVERPERIPLDARKLGYVRLTELPLPRGGRAMAAILAGTDGTPASLRLALPPGERERAEAELTGELPGHAPALRAVAAGLPPPGYRRAGAGTAAEGRAE